ncbi:MAG: cell division protein FtsZ [Bacteroidetes bacterium]|nr:cell division protein FtsZ [Bacteroidota bacterium]
MVFVTAGIGGGTGTGGAPVIAKTARDMGILTVGIVTTPLSVEGKRRKMQAEEGLKELKECVDALLVISNDKVREIHGNLTISSAFSKANDILTIAAKGIAEIITVPGYINVDYEDVNTVLRDSGVALMGAATTSGEDRARKAIEEALSSPLLYDNNIRGASYILLNITSGANEISMDEINEIMDHIQEESQGTDVIMGVCNNEDFEDEISVTVIATGFESAQVMSHMAKKKERIIMPLTNDTNTSSEESAVENEDDADYEDKRQYTFEFDPRIHGKQDSTIQEQENVINEEQEQLLDSEPRLIEKDTVMHDEQETTEENREEEPKLVQKDRVSQLKSMSVKLKNPTYLSEIESEPAYKRKNIILNNPPHSSEQNLSRYTLTENEEGKPEIKENNSFLHDNVD